MAPDRRGDAGRGDRPPGPAARLPGQHRATSGRSPTSGCSAARSSAMIDPAGDDPEPRRHGPRLLGPRRRWPPGRRHPPGLGHRHGHALRRGHRRHAARRRRAGRRRAPGRSQALQRHARSTYLFLLYFDTRAGYGDTGPYPCPTTAGSLLVRDFYRLGQSDFRWSSVAKDVPYHAPHRRARARRRRLHDHRLRHVETTPRGLPRPPRRLRAVHHRRRPPGSLAPVAARRARRRSSPPCARRSRPHYRNIAAMDRDEKIRCGAYVYFSFLKPFADDGRRRPTSSTGPCPATCRPSGTRFFSAMEGDERRRPSRTRSVLRALPGEPTVSLPGLGEPVVAGAPRDEGRHPAGRRAVLERVLVLRLHRTSRAPSAATCGSGCTRTWRTPGTGPAWSARAARSSPSSTTRCRCPTARVDGDPQPRACGPTTPSRRRSTT